MGGMLEFPGVMLRRVAEVGLIGFIAERIEANLAEPDAEWDPEFIRTLLPLMEIFNRYFDAEVRGFERVPERGHVAVPKDPVHTPKQRRHGPIFQDRFLRNQITNNRLRSSKSNCLAHAVSP